MHILFLSHYFPPEVNAPASRTFEHCQRWVKAGHKVSVITCAPNCPTGVLYSGYRNWIYQTEMMDGINVIRIWTFIAANKGFLLRIINYLSYMKMAVIVGIFQRKVDVMIATSPQFFCGWAGVLLHWIRRWPFILEIRDIWPDSILTVGAMKKSLIITGLNYLEKIMYRASSHIVTVGNGYKKKIDEKGIPREKISVIINSVDLELFKRVDDISPVLKRFNSKGKFVCSYIGTVGMAHGLEVVLEAAYITKLNKQDDIVFWIVGEGAHRERLESEANEKKLNNIVFSGCLPKNEMPEIISASAACLVHLKGTELFQTVIPSKIFEFMAMNVPIIMGVKGEARDIVMEAGAGLEMEPDSHESLLECIHTIKKMGREAFKGRDFISQHFNRDDLATKMLSILESHSS